MLFIFCIIIDGKNIDLSIAFLIDKNLQTKLKIWANYDPWN